VKRRRLERSLKGRGGVAARLTKGSNKRNGAIRFRGNTAEGVRIPQYPAGQGPARRGSPDVLLLLLLLLLLPHRCTHLVGRFDDFCEVLDSLLGPLPPPRSRSAPHDTLSDRSIPLLLLLPRADPLRGRTFPASRPPCREGHAIGEGENSSP
jgi:hypothetical protein